MPENPLSQEDLSLAGKINKFPKRRFMATNPSNDSIFGYYDIVQYLADLGYTSSGTLEKTWMDYVRGWKTEPTLNTVIAGGEVWNYVFESSPSNVTYYRYIASDGSEDSFYETFTLGVLGGLLTTKSITI